MWTKNLNAYIEGRGSLATVEQAIVESGSPAKVRVEVEKELAAEWAFKSMFAAIPAPPRGLARALEALRAMPVAPLTAGDAYELDSVTRAAKKSYAAIPEPAGGFAAALGRLKFKLTAAPEPKAAQTNVQDIAPCFDEQPASRTLVELERTKKRTSTRKIVSLPQRTAFRDVLAAGKDLPENPEDLK